MLKDLKIDQSWTLFLDRDGVLNKNIDGDYVRNLAQFEWMPRAPETVVALGKVFGRVIIVTNQQGVGKGLMTAADVDAIHTHIKKTIEEKGGRIDAIYYATQLKSENSVMRKPNTGMALQAKKNFPEIDFSKSIMIGDSLSDMEFGKRMGMKTIFITHGKNTEESVLVDFEVRELGEVINQ